MFGTNVIKTLNKHIKIHWKLILVFSILWVAISILISQATSVPAHWGMYIAPTDFIFDGDKNESSGGFSSGISNVWGFVGFIFFAIVNLIVVFISYVKEMKGGQITVWITSPISRTNLFLSKFIVLLIINSTIFSPSFIILISIAATANDANLYIGHLILQGILFLLFTFFLGSFLILIGIIFSNNTTWFLIIALSLVIYIMITAALNMLYNVLWASEQGRGLTEPTVLTKSLSYVKYFSIQSLYVPILQFSKTTENALNALLIKEGEVIQSSLNIDKQMLIFMICFPLSSNSLTFVFTMSSLFAFKNKDLKI